MAAILCAPQPLIMEEFGKNVTNPLDEGVIEMERNPTFRWVGRARGRGCAGGMHLACACADAGAWSSNRPPPCP